MVEPARRPVTGAVLAGGRRPGGWAPSWRVGAVLAGGRRPSWATAGRSAASGTARALRAAPAFCGGLARYLAALTLSECSSHRCSLWRAVALTLTLTLTLPLIMRMLITQVLAVESSSPNANANPNATPNNANAHHTGARCREQ